MHGKQRGVFFQHGAGGNVSLWLWNKGDGTYWAYCCAHNHFAQVRFVGNGEWVLQLDLQLDRVCHALRGARGVR